MTHDDIWIHTWLYTFEYSTVCTSRHGKTLTVETMNRCQVPHLPYRRISRHTCMLVLICRSRSQQAISVVREQNMYLGSSFSLARTSLHTLLPRACRDYIFHAYCSQYFRASLGSQVCLDNDFAPKRKNGFKAVTPQIVGRDSFELIRASSCHWKTDAKEHSCYKDLLLLRACLPLVVWKGEFHFCLE